MGWASPAHQWKGTGSEKDYILYQVLTLPNDDRGDHHGKN